MAVYFDAFVALSKRRPVNGFAICPIPLSEILLFGSMRGFIRDELDYFVRLMSGMDETARRIFDGKSKQTNGTAKRHAQREPGQGAR